MSDLTESDRRMALLRQDNPLCAAGPPLAMYAAAPAKQRRVGKSGAVHISEFSKGSQVTVVQVEAQTVLVSLRPEREVRELAASIPTPTRSPFEALSSAIRGRTYPADPKRVRGAYIGSTSVAPLDAEDIQDSSERTSRVR